MLCAICEDDNNLLAPTSARLTPHLLGFLLVCQRVSAVQTASTHSPLVGLWQTPPHNYENSKLLISLRKLFSNTHTKSQIVEGNGGGYLEEEGGGTHDFIGMLSWFFRAKHFIFHSTFFNTLLHRTICVGFFLSVERDEIYEIY